MEETLKIPTYIKSIKSMHFSLAGEVEAAAYGPRVICSVDLKMLKVSKPLTSRAGYFFKLCNLVCSDLNIEPDFAFAARLHQALGTHDRMPKTLSDGRNPATIVPPKEKEIPKAVQENNFTRYYQTLTPEQKASYDNDFVPHGYRHCTPDELAERQSRFAAVDVSDNVYKILPMGYAARVYRNLRFMDLDERT